MNSLLVTIQGSTVFNEFYLEYLAPAPSFTETFFIMATDRVNDQRWVASQASSTSSSTTLPRHHMEDITSTSYIPRMARMIPTSMTVHTFFVKKISFPMTSRPDELWILERTIDGTETWNPNVLRTAANQWRQQYAVPVISSSSPTSHFPVLPHSEHPDVYFDRPVSVIPDHTHTFCKPVGDAPHNITPKGLLHPFSGHLGALHHHLHLLAQLIELRLHL